MESHQYFGYGVTGAALSYPSSYPSVPSMPNRLFGSLKLDIGNSTSSPFSSQYDCETYAATLSDSQDRHSSTENLSGESSSYFSGLNPSVDCQQESLQIFPGGTSLLQDESSSQNIKLALLKLETTLMGPDDDEEVNRPYISLGKTSRPQTSDQKPRVWSQERQDSHVIQTQTSFVSRQRQFGEGAHVEKRQKEVEEVPLRGIPSGDLKQLLIACAKALDENKVNDFDKLIEKARSVVSISGEPIQRLGAYLIEGLVARKESSANGAIAEACKNEDRIHIIDFHIAQGTQWMTLLQALASRPSGAPHVRITGIDDPLSKYARGDGLEAVARQLTAFSEKFNIPIEFHGVPVFAPDVTQEMFDVRPGEALAVNFPLELHHTPDESVDVNNPRDSLLRMIKSLNPKVVTLVEQESNTNTTPFLTRFVETLNYYLAIFESIDVRMPRDQKERISVEQHCLARDIVNVIACEGKEREERHELLRKWKSRFTMAGFRQWPLSSYLNSVIRSLLRCYSEHYTLVEIDGAMLLGWKDRNLISASAWC
ncbi:hypothetical protein OIU77_008821 [Salix suchowensis]|uniref:GRAS family transcription factor n=1 Tax=Salix suchowensis TaxID=1278906 RepID=A0ABQ9ACA5_9ROSI|nr:hypothetical protein OIU77_008821 [Salix suchowensis]